MKKYFYLSIFCGAATTSIMTPSIMTPSITTLSIAIRKMPTVVMLSATIKQHNVDSSAGKQLS
jgi:hypothetical protein